ncbi:MAG: STAS domain-containing protein [Micrococcales bacterium]|nr:STAS domain-containing protein [Micrococcales bacterium]
MIEITTSASSVTLAIVGDLDLAERDQFPQMAAKINQLCRPRLVIDMCQAVFMDSAGAGFLISLAGAAAKHGGTAVLRGIGPRDEFVLEVCGALEMFRIDRDHTCELSRPSA